VAEQLDTPDKTKNSSFERNVLQTAKGGSFLAAGSLFEFGMRFVIAFLLARVLGAEQYGMYNLAISAAVIVASISALGMDDGMIRYIAVMVSKRDEKGVWGTLQIGFGIGVVMSILTGAGLFLLAEPIGERLFHEPQLVPLLRLFSLIVPPLTLSNILVGAARGFKRMDYSALAENVIQFVIRLVLIGVLALIGLNVFVASIVFGLSELAATITLIYFLHKEFSFKRPVSEARRDFREIFNFALPFWMSGLLSKFRKNIQVVLLGTLNTVTGVGVFSIVSSINMLGRVSYLSIIASVKPFLAELYTQRNLEQMGRLYQTTTRWTLMTNLPIFLLMVLYPAPLLSIFGESFVAGAPALVILAYAELANAGTGICGSIIDMTGYTKLKLINSVIWVVLLSVSNVLLIPRWEILGAAAATLISTATINLLRIVEVWILLRLQPYNRSFLKPLAAGLGAFVGAQILGQWLSADATLVHTALHVLFVLTVYAGLTWVMRLAPEDKTVLLRLNQQASFLFSQGRARLTGRLPARSG
jgi:O-antigen/teichoic acid export membrane protein